MTVQQDLDRILTRLRNLIRERGYTTLEVRQSLGWGRSHFSLLFSKQRPLRVEEVLLVLGAIKVEPADFWRSVFESEGAAGSRAYDGSNGTGGA